MLKIALAQINPAVADFDGNSRKIIANIRKAKEKGADLLVFPELSLAGYPPEDLLLKAHFVEENFRYLNAVKKYCSGIIVVIGFIDRKEDKIYNAAALLQDKKIKDVYHKRYLPNYGVFDEKRYFTPGDSIPIYQLGDYNFSITICEDIWKRTGIEFLKNRNLDFVLNLSASPFHLGKVSLRKKILSAAAKEINTFIFYCNLAGGQDELVFDGTSKILSSRGEVIACAKRFEEDFVEFDFDKNKRYSVKKISAKKEEETFCALRMGLFDYVHKNGFKKVIVGVSGGIDSAVVAALAAVSLGNENVCAVLMPSMYTSQATFIDAKKLCENLRIKYYIVSIEKMFEGYLSALALHFGDTEKDKTEENLQARIRGNILMAFSNKFGYLVLNTGNKSEISCGYCTLYGDMVGGFGILKDVPKTLVFTLASYINKVYGKKVIPLSVIKRAPSAELKPDQKDSNTLPEYDLLDPILKLYVEDNCSLEEIVQRGFDRKITQKVIRMVDANEYKRRQSPLGIKITPRAFGKDRRMPVTNRFFS